MNEWVGSKIRKNETKYREKRRQDLSKFRKIQINNTSEFYKFYDQKITDILSKKQLEKKIICIVGYNRMSPRIWVCIILANP